MLKFFSVGATSPKCLVLHTGPDEDLSGCLVVARERQPLLGPHLRHKRLYLELDHSNCISSSFTFLISRLALVPHFDDHLILDVSNFEGELVIENRRCSSLLVHFGSEGAGSHRDSAIEAG